jgi:hypothetical protein
MRLLYISFLIFVVVGVRGQEVQSPQQFLGYPLGSHFTPHDKIVAYFREVAKEAPDRMLLKEYGRTYEGRPLLLAFIGTPANLQRLEAIRQNNLRLAGVLKDGVAADEHGPVIVWLSYNVHGNEPASSEAAMKTMYELVSGGRGDGDEMQMMGGGPAVWLKNAIVVIDPCINPDGRDRYVNWYNGVVGQVPNPDPQAREHREPWPRGRSNHYNFDLNRDWAWQTQVETQKRLEQYNDWLPQVHVDYHEQGWNSPYYFAPAAEPYHEVITPWQREFQVLIGKNNAKYFDHHGWLFFTKQEFDLFYPSYGDTYPTYNGAIGMTFEQGGISAGLAVQTSDGDTLRLADRLEHHYMTGLSTIEVASQHAGRLIKEFHTYFEDAVGHPGGEFKAYYIRSDSFGDRLQRLKRLLDRNRIQWVYAPEATYLGLSYETGRMASFRSAGGDIVINANQPKSNLLRVLLERQSRISDSVTYDITAWSVPYVYGLQAYGLNNYVAGASGAGGVGVPKGAGGVGVSKGAGGVGVSDSVYAYAVRWAGLNSAELLCQLLRKGVKVRFVERPFQSGGSIYDRGTLLITPAGNGELGPRLWDWVADNAKDLGVGLSSIASGFVDKGPDLGSDLVRMVHPPRVAMLTGDQVNSEDAGEVWHLFEQELHYPITLLNATDVRQVSWKNFDVVILPNGNYRLLEDKGIAEGLKGWVREGGRLIAMQDAVAQLVKGEWGIQEKGAESGQEKAPKVDADQKEDYALLHRYDDRQREEVMNSVPGAIYRVELDNTHPLAFGYPDHYYTLKQGGNAFEFIREDGWNVGVIRKDNYVSGFAGNKAKERLKDGLIFGVQDFGRGKVVYMADDPLFRSFWENGKLLFCNAVFLVGQ